MPLVTCPVGKLWLINCVCPVVDAVKLDNELLAGIVVAPWSRTFCMYSPTKLPDGS